MATVVNTPADTRFSDIGNALAQSIDFIIKKNDETRRQNATKESFIQALNAPNWEQGMAAISGMPKDVDPQTLAAMTGIISERHRGTQPETPTEAGRIDATLSAAISRIQSAADIARAARETTQSEGRLNRGAASDLQTARGEQQTRRDEDRPAIERATKVVTAARDEGIAATGLRASLAEMKALGSISTGPITPAVVKGLSTLKQLGVDTSFAENLTNIDVGTAQTIQSLSAKATLDALGGHFGTGISDADRETTSKIVPNIGNSPEANELISTISDAQAAKSEAIGKEIAKMEKAKVPVRDQQARIEELRQINVITPELTAKLQALAQSNVTKMNTPEQPTAPQSQINLTGKKPGESFKAGTHTFKIIGGQ